MSKFFSEKVFIVPTAKRPFHNKKDALYFCQDNGIDPKQIDAFDSKKEYERYLILKALERGNEISGLRRQVVFEIIPERSHEEVIGSKNANHYRLGNFTFTTKTEADKFAKSHNIPRKEIQTISVTIPEVKLIIDEKKAEYTADFTYMDKNGEYIVEDVKSDYTRKEKDYVLRRKLMLDRHNIKIKEII